MWDDAAYGRVGHPMLSKVTGMETPTFDRIAEEGAIFENSFCSNAICAPSRAVVLTGKHSHKNGFMVNESTRFDGSQQTFPKLLQQNGYQTAIVGKWHLKSQPEGFDYWEVLPGQGMDFGQGRALEVHLEPDPQTFRRRGARAADGLEEAPLGQRLEVFRDA